MTNAEVRAALLTLIHVRGFKCILSQLLDIITEHPDLGIYRKKLWSHICRAWDVFPNNSKLGKIPE